MTLAAALVDRVPSRVRHRGLRYFQQGRVRVLACDPQKVEAIVSGSSRYRVSVALHGGEVESTCTCPYFDRSRTCKHIWAAVLAADARSTRGPGGPGGDRHGRRDRRDRRPPPGGRGEQGGRGDRIVDGNRIDRIDPGSSAAPVAPAQPARGPRPARGNRRGRTGTPRQAPAAHPAPADAAAQGPRTATAPGPVPRRGPQRRKGPRKGPPGRSRIPIWMEVLETLPDGAVADLPREALLYEVDEAATRETGRLTLGILEGRKRGDGAWDHVHPLRLRRAEIPDLPDAVDRKIVSILAGANPDPNRARASIEAAPVPARWDVTADVAGDLLPLLCETGRCRVRRPPGRRGGGGFLTLDEGLPWELWLEVRENAKGGCSVTGSLRRNGKRIPLNEPLLLFPSGWMLTADRVSRLDAGEAFSWISLLRGSSVLRVPSEWKEDLLERLVSHQPLKQIDLPKNLAMEELRLPARPIVRLTQPLLQPRGALDAEVSFVYGDREIHAGTPGRAVYLKDPRRLLVRDPEAEKRALEQLEQLDFRPGDGPLHLMKVQQGWASSALVKLLAEGWSVELHGRLYRPPGLSRLSVSSGLDWFDVRGEVDFEGVTARLPDVLDAIRRGSTFLSLSDGSEGLIPAEWVKRLAGLAELGELEGDHLRFEVQQATLLDAWLADQPGATWDEAFDAARRRLHSFEGIVPAAAPPGFEGELRGYQRDRPRLAPLPARLRLRRLPGRRHGPRQDRAGARPARSPPRGAQAGEAAAVPRRRAALAGLQLARRGGALHPGLRILDHTGLGRAKDGRGLRRLRPRPHDLRHAAPGHRDARARWSSTT